MVLSESKVSLVATWVSDGCIGTLWVRLSAGAFLGCSEKQQIWVCRAVDPVLSCGELGEVCMSPQTEDQEPSPSCSGDTAILSLQKQPVSGLGE